MYSLKQIKKWLESELSSYDLSVTDSAKREILKNCTDKNIREENQIVKDKDQKNMFE